MNTLRLLFIKGIFLQLCWSQKRGVTDKDFSTTINISPNVKNDIIINNSNPKNQVVTINKHQPFFKYKREEKRYFDEDYEQRISSDSTIPDEKIDWSIGNESDEEKKEEEKLNDEFYHRNITIGRKGMSRKNLRLPSGVGQVIIDMIQLPQIDTYSFDLSNDIVQNTKKDFETYNFNLNPNKIKNDLSPNKINNLHIIKLGYHLKQNLLNTLGYIMYQPLINIDKKLFFALSCLKSEIELNEIDVFRLIPILPEIHTNSFFDQIAAILDFIYIKIKRCKLGCINDFWRELRFEFDSNFNRFNNLLFNEIDLDKIYLIDLNDLNGKNENVASIIFPPIIAGVLEDIKNEEFCLNEEFVGFLLNFYPFSLSDKDVDRSLNELSLNLIEFDVNKNSAFCKLDLHDFNFLGLKPIELLKEVLDRILESFCGVNLKGPAKVIRKALDDNLTINNYRNIFKFKFIFSDLSKLLNPSEIKIFDNSNCLADGLDILSVSSKRSQYYCENISGDVFDRDYINTMWKFNNYVENVIEYISGFVVKKILSLNMCIFCKNYLVSSEKYCLLINLKNEGKLIYPSKDTYKI